jgi:hypothetical protein
MPPAAFLARTRLWKALESVHPVRIYGCAPGQYAGLSGLIALGDIAVVPDGGIPLLHATTGEPLIDEPGSVSLSDELCLDSRLRGQVLNEDRCGHPAPLATQGRVVLASIDGMPVWTADRKPWRHTTAMMPSELGPHEVIRDRFCGTRFLGLLPILEMLRHVTTDLAWKAPALRAAFILDDPNLHWPSYGFADFAALGAAAEEHRFHVAIATVPLDLWLSHPRAVRLFRQRKGLSLLMHGNDHLSCELGRELPESDLTRVAAQAQRRAAGLERRTGLSVARVMAPPHGACSEGMLRTLRRTGFDAACISRPFPWLERPPANALAAQWQISDVLEGCVPVIPRYSFDGLAQDIVLRAYLDQPLILYGHHWDLSGGLDRLVERAARINALGDVRWISLDEIAATNYLLRRRDDEHHVRLFTRRARLELDHTASRLIVHHGESQTSEDAELLEVRQPGAAPYMAPLNEQFRLQSASGPIDLRLLARDAIDPRRVAAPKWTAWPRARRLLVEGRDRVRPITSRVGRRTR